MLPDGRRIGPHLPLGHGMVRAAERAHAIGADTLQVFGDNPTAWHRRETPPAELPAFRRRLDELGLGPLAIHAPYLVNLAAADDEIHDRSVAVLTHDLRAAAGFDARFLNVHVGSHRGSGPEAGIDRVGAALARVLAAVPTDGAPTAPLLVLENSAGSGDGLGVDVDELGAILDSATAHGVDPDRLGFCLDTAHAWSAGHRLDDPVAIDELLAAFDARIGLRRLVMIHLNDSKAACGSRNDRHEHVGAGRIGVAGLRHLLTHPSLAHTTAYLETPAMEDGFDAVNLARAIAIARGEPLPELPPLPADAAVDEGGHPGAEGAGVRPRRRATPHPAPDDHPTAVDGSGA
jgi:deoxyribonuclease-4